MKKFIIIIIFLSLLLCGCSKKTPDTTKPADIAIEDFSLYDTTGREVDFLTPQNDYISVAYYDDDYADYQTYREVRCGDRGTSALKKYDLSNFTWGIGSYVLNSDDLKNQAKNLENKYKEYSAEEIIDYIDTITAYENMELFFFYEAYEYDSKLYHTQEECPWDGENFEKMPVKYELVITILDQKVQSIRLSR